MVENGCITKCSISKESSVARFRFRNLDDFVSFDMICYKINTCDFSGKIMKRRLHTCMTCCVEPISFF